MHLYFQIQNLQQSVFYMDGQEYLVNLNSVLLCFLFHIIKVNQFLYRYIILLNLVSSFSLTKSLLVPYAFFSIESFDCILKSSFEIKAILLISLVKTLCLSFLIFCCVFIISLLFLTNYLWFFNTIYVNLAFF